MRKLLVLLLALVMIVAVFAQEAAQAEEAPAEEAPAEEAPAITLEDVAKDVEALKEKAAKLDTDLGSLMKRVYITGKASARLKIDFDSTTGEATFTVANPTLSVSLNLPSSVTAGKETGFNVWFSVSECKVARANVYQYIFMDEALKIRYWLGALARTTYYVGRHWLDPNGVGYKTDVHALGLDFWMKSGDLTDNLIIYAHFPSNKKPIVNLDVYNSLSFDPITLKFLALDILPSDPASPTFPVFGVDASIDISKALKIEGGTLEGFAYLKIDPNETGMKMLPNYMFGVNWEIEEFSGSVYFEGPDTVGASVETTLLSPVTLGAGFETPVTSVDFSKVSLKAYAKWKYELLSHELLMLFENKEAKITWTISVSF